MLCYDYHLCSVSALKWLYVLREREQMQYKPMSTVHKVNLDSPAADILINHILTSFKLLYSETDSCHSI